MPLNYCELNYGSREVPNSLLAGMLRLRWHNNPDFEHLYPSVDRWYCEIDADRARVVREVGLDRDGQPIVLGPFGRNDGVWNGVGGPVSGDECKQIEKSLFEKAWQSLELIYRDRVPPKRIEPRVPVTERHQIVGHWTVDCLGPPGAMSDQIITFRPDGIGFFEEINVRLACYDEFQWEVARPGRLTIRGIAYCEPGNGSQAFRGPSTFNYTDISAETQLHHSGGGFAVEVLYLPLRGHPEAFGRRTVHDYHPRLLWDGVCTVE